MEKIPHIKDRILITNIINSLPHYIFWKDRNLVFQGCNQQFAHQFGYNNADQVIGKTDADFPWSNNELREKYKKDDLLVIQTGEPLLNIEEQQPQPDGSVNYVLVSKVPLLGENGDIAGVLGIYTDITAKKQQEKALNKALKQAKQANRAKSDFIANMSHDLRTPITGMLGMIHDLLNTAQQSQSSMKNDNTELLVNLIQTIQQDGGFLMKATDELLLLCNEILEVVSLESDKPMHHPETFDLRKLVKHNLDLLAPVARHKKLDLSYEINEGIPNCLFGLRTGLDRILLNLISNALKFTDSGFVKLTIQTQQSAAASAQNNDSIDLMILVEDSGIGIPKDKYDLIFEHFSRLTPAYEGIYKGAGLGLYAVKRYIETMKGHICVTSKVNKGTCFTVTLPFIISDQQNISTHVVQNYQTTVHIPTIENKHRSANTQQTTNTILIVEDNTLAAIAVQTMLSALNCNSEIAESSKQAIKMVQTGNYDLILMDIGLPDYNGYDTTKKIRALPDSTKSNTPVIALTGHANNSENQEKATEAGMQAVITKPARFNELKAILQRYLLEK